MQHHDVPRFTHTFVIYEADTLPELYQGKLFGVAPLQSHLVMSQMVRRGATFATKDIGHPFQSKDPWVRPVDIQVGPDGGIYVADFYEQRIDHASHYQGRVDKESGRVYRLRAAQSWDYGDKINLADATNEQLLQYLAHPNKWYRQTALRIIGDRRDPNLASRLQQLLPETHDSLAVHYLWALYQSGGWTEDVALQAVGHPHPQVRVWAIRLACDDRAVGDSLLDRLVELANSEPDVDVRCQLACSARRLSSAPALRIARQLIQHDGDLQDPYLPLLNWWLLESQVADQASAVASTFAGLWEHAQTPGLAEKLMRRLIQSGRRSDLVVAAQLLESAPQQKIKQQMMKGFEQALQGRTLAGLPAVLIKAIADAGGLSLELRLRRGEPAAIREVERLIRAGTDQQRLGLITVVGETRESSLVKSMLVRLRESSDQREQLALLGALQNFKLDDVAATTLERLSDFKSESQASAYALLASRPEWIRATLPVVREQNLQRSPAAREFARRALLQTDPQLREAVTAVFGSVAGATSTEMFAEVERITAVLGEADGNPYSGKRLFESQCGKCHRLFDEGGRIGPDLTEYKRDDLQRFLLNVVNPSAEIREGYETFLVITDDGRTLSGFVEDQDEQLVVLKDAEGHQRPIARDSILEMRALPTSVMPQQLLSQLQPQQLRDLFAYLRSTQPLP